MEDDHFYNTGKLKLSLPLKDVFFSPRELCFISEIKFYKRSAIKFLPKASNNPALSGRYNTRSLGRKLGQRLVLGFIPVIEVHKGVTKFIMEKEVVHLSSYGIKHYAEIIEKCQLYKVHKSYYINLDKVQGYLRSDRSILMPNDKTVPLGKTFRAEFKNKMNNLKQF